MTQRSKRAKTPSAAKLAERSEDGVDLTLIRWMLSLTPAQRLQVLQSAAESLLRMRAAQEKS